MFNTSTSKKKLLSVTITLTGLVFLLLAPVGSARKFIGTCDCGYLQGLSNEMRVFDTADLSNVGTSAAPVTGSYDVAVSPDGKTAYVAHDYNQIVKAFDTEDFHLKKAFQVTKDPNASPGQLAVGASGKRLVAAASDTKYVYISDTETGKTVKNLALTGSNVKVKDVVVGKGGTRAFVSVEATNQVRLAVIDNIGAENTDEIAVSAEINVGQSMRGLAISEDEKNVYMTDTTTGVQRIRTAVNADADNPADVSIDESKTVDITGYSPRDIVSHGDWIYAVDLSNFIVVSKATKAVVKSINVSGNGGGVDLDINSTGTRVFTSGGGIFDTIDPVNTTRKKVVKRTDGTAVGGQGSAITPDDKTVLVTNASTSLTSVLGPADAQNITDIALKEEINYGSGYRGAAFTPDSKRALVTVSNTSIDGTTSANTLTDMLVVSLSGKEANLNNTPAIIGSITGLGGRPEAVAIPATGSYAYVVNRGSNDLSVIDLTTYKPLPERIPVGQEPVDIAVTSNAERAFVTNKGSNTVSVVDIDPDSDSFNQVIATAQVGTSPSGVAVTPDGSEAWVVNSGSDDVSIIDNTEDPNDIAESGTVNLSITPANAERIVITPDGLRAYVSAMSNIVLDDTVRVINIEDRSLELSLLRVLDSPLGVVATPDSAKVYVANSGSANISQINTDSLAVNNSSKDVTKPLYMAMEPNQGPTAKYGVEKQATGAGDNFTFNGFGSTDPDGTVAEYNWDFGDGQKLAGGNAKPDHSYTDPGAYTVGLDVVDNDGGSNKTVQTGSTVSHVASSTSTYSSTVYVPPSTQITANPEPETTSTTAEFDFASDGDAIGAQYECAIDGDINPDDDLNDANFTPCNANHKVEGLEVGEHTLAVRAFLMQGDVKNADLSPETYSWEVLKGTTEEPPEPAPTPAPAPVPAPLPILAPVVTQDTTPAKIDSLKASPKCFGASKKGKKKSSKCKQSIKFSYKLDKASGVDLRVLRQLGKNRGSKPRSKKDAVCKKLSGKQLKKLRNRKNRKSFEKKNRLCNPEVEVSKQSLNGSAGGNELIFKGQIGGKRLKSGTYLFEFTPAGSGTPAKTPITVKL